MCDEITDACIHGILPLIPMPRDVDDGETTQVHRYG